MKSGRSARSGSVVFSSRTKCVNALPRSFISSRSTRPAAVIADARSRRPRGRLAHGHAVVAVGALVEDVRVRRRSAARAPSRGRAPYVVGRDEVARRGGRRSRPASRPRTSAPRAGRRSSSCRSRRPCCCRPRCRRAGSVAEHLDVDLGGEQVVGRTARDRRARVPCRSGSRASRRVVPPDVGVAILAISRSAASISASRSCPRRRRTRPGSRPRRARARRSRTGSRSARDRRR